MASTTAKAKAGSESESDSEGLVDLDCLADLKIDCEAGSQSACEELTCGKACKKKDISIPPSFKPPTVKRNPDGSVIHTFREHPLSHTEKKILEHIESDRPLYSGAHVAKIPPATPPMMPPFAMGPMGPMGA